MIPTTVPHTSSTAFFATVGGKKDMFLENLWGQKWWKVEALGKARMKWLKDAESEPLNLCYNN